VWCSVWRRTSPGDTAFHAAFADLSSDKKSLHNLADMIV